MNIFRYIDYKLILSKYLIFKKESVHKSYTFQKMAEHCRVQKTYLSKVLNRDGHLTEDQLFLACDFLGFNQEESDYTLLLLSHEKCMVNSRKKLLKDKINEIQRRYRKTESELTKETTSLSSTDLSLYHLDPCYSLIHIFLTIEEYSRQPDIIAEKLNLDTNTLKSYLINLEAMGLIRRQSDRMVATSDDMHLSEDSPVYKSYRALMRMKAIENMNRYDQKRNYGFSVVFSTDEEVRDKIHSEFLKLIGRAQKYVKSGQEKEVYQLNFDLLKWS